MRKEDRSVGNLIAEPESDNRYIVKRAVLSLARIGARKGGKTKGQIIQLLVSLYYDSTGTIDRDVRDYISNCLARILCEREILKRK